MRQEVAAMSNGDSDWLRRMPALGQLNVIVVDRNDLTVGNVLVSFHMGECMGALERLGIEPKVVYGLGDAEDMMLQDDGLDESAAADFRSASNAMMEIEGRMHEALKRENKDGVPLLRGEVLFLEQVQAVSHGALADGALVERRLVFWFAVDGFDENFRGVFDGSRRDGSAAACMFNFLGIGGNAVLRKSLV